MELLQASFQWPNIVPSVLMTLVIMYWLLAIVGAMDIELFDFDLDGDVDADVDGLEGITGVGLVVLRWLNIGHVPLMIWGSIFATTFWFVSMLLWDYWDAPETSADPLGGSLLLLRNLAVSVALAKLATNPMRKWFAVDPGLRPEQMVGHTCELSTSLSPGVKGQAKFRTNAAPRLIMVRCEKGEFQKGDVVELVKYEPETKSFWVHGIEGEV